jgi:phage I-like protein
VRWALPGQSDGVLNVTPATSFPPASRAVLSVAAPFRRGGAEAGLPQRVRILKWGENVGRTTGARILVDEVVAETLAANQELVAIERVPMDYEHQSVKDHPNYQPDPRHSPGAGTIEVVVGEGVYLSRIDYSPSGLEHAPGYQDVSGVIHLDAECRPLWISSVALTQTGDVAGMEFSEAMAVLSARFNPLTSPDPQIQPAMTPADYRPLLLKMLKLPDDTTDEELVAAAETEGNAPSEPQDPMTPPVADTTAALSALTTRLTELEARATGSERAALVARASREGKVIPLSAELITQTSVAVLTAMVDALPAGEVPLDATQRKVAPADSTAALSADESHAAKLLGLSPEQYQKGKTAA